DSMPTLWGLPVRGCGPGGGTGTWPGWTRSTTQQEGGRIPDRPVGVPIASGTMKSPTEAAEPLDEPPGVCAGLCGLAVGPGWRLANSVVTVLPSRIPPAAHGRLAALAVKLGRHPV